MSGKIWNMLRDESGLSQMQLAKKIGVSDAIICKWENDLNEPKASYIVKLCEFFDVSPSFLLGLEDEFGSLTKFKSQKKVQYKNTTPLSDDEQQLLYIYKKLSHTNKQTLAQVLRVVVPEQESNINIL